MKEISVQELQLNPMTLIAKQWMLVTAGDEKNGYNTMTASWGHLGSIWGHGGGLPTSVIFVRPQRYTKQFVDREPLYTLCFFPEEYRPQLAYLGSHSGRDEDKIAKSGLHVMEDNNTPYFEEADTVLICRKLYAQAMKPEYMLNDWVDEKWYPQKDYHVLYIAAIEKVLVKE